MAGPQFRVELDRLRALAVKTEDLASDINAIMSELTGRLSGEGSPWGSDEPGQRFSDPYLPKKASIDDVLDGQKKFMSGNAEAMHTSVDAGQRL